MTSRVEWYDFIYENLLEPSHFDVYSKQSKFALFPLYLSLSLLSPHLILVHLDLREVFNKLRRPSYMV